MYSLLYGSLSSQWYWDSRSIGNVRQRPLAQQRGNWLGEASRMDLGIEQVDVISNFVQTLSFNTTMSWRNQPGSTIWFLELTVVLRLKVHWKCETTSTCSTTRKLAVRSITNELVVEQVDVISNFIKSLSSNTTMSWRNQPVRSTTSTLYYMVPWAHGGIETQGPLEMWDNVHLFNDEEIGREKHHQWACRLSIHYSI